MSDHSFCLVPLQAWAYNSPDRKDIGSHTDIGLFAEALIYYDKVIININSPLQFAELLEWFVRQNKFGDFLTLLRENSLQIYETSFATVTLLRDGAYSVYNIEDTNQKEPNTFERRYLHHPSVLQWLDNSRQNRALVNALRDNIIEVKASELGLAIEQARLDQSVPERNTIILQAFTDEIYRLRGLGRPPSIQSKITSKSAPGQHTITWNTNIYNISQIAKPIPFNPSTTLVAGAISNQLLLSASILGCDLFVGRPMGTLIGDKLYETGVVIKPQAVVEHLKREVEFPDIRKLVNTNTLNYEEIIEVRKGAKRFREWLQQEGDRDRNAIVAYHNEAAKELGFRKAAPYLLSLFGAISGNAIDNVIGGVIGAAAGVALAEGADYIATLMARHGAGWKPIVFGDWLKERIEKYIEQSR